MAWDRGYYYRVCKENGRVVREYVGRGHVAQLIAEMDELQREERNLKRAADRQERIQVHALTDQLDKLDKLADLAARAALLAAGFHKHNRGEWRKRRGQTEQTG